MSRSGNRTAPPPGAESGATSAGEEHLQRKLTNRHIQLIAIGGAIGTGLFMGSGKTISVAGPSILLVYLTIGAALYVVMRAMGELLLHNLDYKSFQDFAADILGPGAGFAVGWSYWFGWVVCAMADFTAMAGYFTRWTSRQHDAAGSALTDAGGGYVDLGVPLWVPVLFVLVVLLMANLMAANWFGELEFWFALIKIVAIVGLILVGAYLAITHFRVNDTVTASFTHLWDRGGFFPRGLDGFLAGFQIAIFAFVAMEIVGTTAAEAKDPVTTLPRAINAIPVRILIFYLGALAAIMAVTPWDMVDPNSSPFVVVFGLIGLTAAASIINFVVITAAASSDNSGIYSTARMLYGLAERRQAPRFFTRLNKQHIPAVAVLFSVACMTPSLFLLYAGNSVIEVFTLFTTMASVLWIFIWSIILVSFLVYLRRHPQAHRDSVYRMPGGPVLPIIVLAFFAFIVWVLTLQPDTRSALMVTPLWFGALAVGWFFVRRNQRSRVAGRPEGTPPPTA